MHRNRTMPARTTRTSTTRLPYSLLERINEPADSHHSHGRKVTQPLVSRKEARKLERIGRKKRKAQFFSTTSSSFVEEEHAKKKAKVSGIQPSTSESVLSRPAQPKSKLQTPLKTHLGQSSSAFRKSFKSQREKDEDAYIAYLESKLGHKPGQNARSASGGDGLDDLFDFTSSLVPLTRDFERDTSTIGSTDEDEETDEWSGIQDVSPVDTATGTKSTTVSRYIPPQVRHTKLDNEKDSEDLVKLHRQLKGLLNRLSEQNMVTILDGVEELFRIHRRHDVTNTLTKLIIDGISSHSSLLDSYVVLYAAFVSSLHKIVGLEFAAFFVQNVVSTYERYYKALQDIPSVESLQDDLETRGKECLNVIVLVSELYNFQVISAVLVFDIIRGLLDEKLTEFTVELLLKVVRNSGQQLRHDDPSALKDIIQIVQSKLSDEDNTLSSRTRFMIETLTNLKNNKLKRNITQNQGGDAVERMKKFLSSLTKKRHILAHEPLRVSLEDLRSAESKGKWWLVGAAWGGDPLLDHRHEAKSGDANTVDDVNSNTLLKLARQQGMNTDVRRSIFVVLMSSDDYVDACDRLSQLNLTEVQQREIVKVILHCCGNEKSYNPYYTLVCQHLCRTSHSHKITLQFCFWDFLRDLGESTVGGAEVTKNLKDDGDRLNDVQISDARLKNIAKAYAWWIAKDCSSLAIFKPVDFTAIKKQTIEFLRELFIQLFVSSQVSTPIIGSSWKEHPIAQQRNAVEAIFKKVAQMKALAMGLAYFISETFRGGDEEKLVKWASEIAKDTLRSGVDII